MKKLQRVIATLISIFVLSSCITNVMADGDTGNNGTVSATRANMSFIYLGHTSDYFEAPQSLTPQAYEDDLQVNDVVWVGVQFSNMSKIREFLGSAKKGTADGGWKNFVVGLYYDSEYLELDKDALNMSDYSTYQDNAFKVVSGNFPVAGNNKYSITVLQNVTGTTANGTTGKQPDFSSKDTAKTVTYTTATSASVAGIPRLFHDNTAPFASGMVGDSPVVLAAFAFKVKKVPENPATTHVLMPALGQSTFTIGGGHAGNAPGASWIDDQTISADKNLKNFFNVTTADGSEWGPEYLDIFPAPKAVSGVALKSGTAPTLTGLVAGGKINLSNVKLTVTYTSGTPLTEDVTPDSFAFGDSGVTDGSGLTPFTSNTALVKDTHNTKHLYAICTKNNKTYSVDLGEMTVKAAKTVASVSVTGAISDFTYGGKVATTGLQPKVQYTEPADWPEEPIATGGKWLIVKPDGSSADLNANTVYPAGNGYKVRLTYSGKSADTAAFNITKKALSVPASVGNAKAVTAGATGDDLKVNGTYTFETADGLVGSDVVTATWSGAYANANAAGSVEVDVTLAATLDGAAKDNYTFAGGASKANGTVSDDPLKTIAVTAPTGSFTTDTGIDLTTLKAKGTKNSGAVDFDAANFDAIIAAGCEVLVDGVKTETAQVAVTTEGSHTIKVTKGGVEGTATVTVGAGATVAPVEKPVVGDITNASAKVTNAPADANTVKYAIVEVTGEENIVAPAADAYTAGKVAFDELKKDTKYVIFAIALGNGTTVVDSEPVHSDVFKTFKNKITILDKNEDEMSVGYADDIAELTEDKLHEIVEEPSRLDGYYTDVAFENVVEFPIALTDDLTLYAKIKKSSGGGGGGGGWNTSTTKPALSLNQKALSGHVGETATLRATLTDSTAKITWESDNEAVATVDENGVVTFVAVGTANITATAGSLKETAEVTVVADDVVVPTEESLINEKYTGPYVYGYEDGTFGAAREITRAEVVAMVSRLLKNPIDENKNYDTNFTDVADGAWYKNYIGFLAQYNIVEGYGDGTFAPANKITRAEMTAILARAAKFQLTGDATTFSDVENSFWAKAYIATMAEKNLVNGYPDGTFAPNKNITRAETVTILNRMLDDSTVSGSIIPADVDSSYWAYNDIVKAMNDRVLD